MAGSQEAAVRSLLERSGVPAPEALEIARLGNVDGTADLAVSALVRAGMIVKRLTWKGGTDAPLVAGDVVELPADMRLGSGRALVVAVDGTNVTLHPVAPGPCVRAECRRQFAAGAATCRHGRTEREALVSVALQVLAALDAFVLAPADDSARLLYELVSLSDDVGTGPRTGPVLVTTR